MSLLYCIYYIISRPAIGVLITPLNNERITLCEQVAKICNSHKQDFFEAATLLAAAFPQQDHPSWKCPTLPSLGTATNKKVVCVDFTRCRIIKKQSRVLFVEDDPDVIALLKALFEGDLEHVVMFASTGTAALSFLMLNSFDTIFVDINLPDICGFDILKIIREIPMKKYIISGDDNIEYKEAATRYGVLEYIVKPFAPEKILVAVR